MMKIAWLYIVVLATGCGWRRVAGYVEELEDCSATMGETGETTQGAGSSGDTGSSGTTAEDPGTTGTSTGPGDSTGTTQAGTTAASSSGGEPMPVCGNGVLEAFGDEPEECDDGNIDADDGCSETCALDRRVFVSSVLYPGGKLGGVHTADAYCANRADDQGWPEALKYQAWLSDSTTDARDRLKRGRGRLVLANGLVFARSWSALLAGEVENPLEVTEKSETYHGGVWTGTRPDGTAVPGSEHCDDWTTKSVLTTGHFGYSDRATTEWTMAAEDDSDQPAPCPADFAIYCFQSL